MRKTMTFVLTGCLLIILSFSPFLISGTANKVCNSILSNKAVLSDSAVHDAAFSETSVLYDSLQLQPIGLSKQAFEYALKGYKNLQKKGLLVRKDILSICDFSQSSKNKRLYIIDVEHQKLLLNTYVAHGKNSGSEYANSFSNNPESLKSSLGFYVTRNTYYGGHGLSLRIDGLEKGFNDKADKRNIVVHGSDYVGAGFLRYNAFSGRSFGCPAVPANQIPVVINTIKDGSCLFIYHPTKNYLTRSTLLNA
ncbi:MAG: murein L,D-transpeptidase catalytic domain family protein [Chitinophagaceae bacterium]